MSRATPATGDIAEKIDTEGRFTGGPVKSFDIVGRDTLITLLENGLLPNHKVLDVGCGALRNGYWLVRLLDPGCYFGFEPDPENLNTGIKHCLDEDLCAEKGPRFSNNDRCDFSVFEAKFDMVFARSVITHGGPGMVRKLFEQFSVHAVQDAVMLLSYWPNGYDVGCGKDSKRVCMSGDNLALDDWRFIYVMTYSFGRLKSWAEEYGLVAMNWLERPTINNQVWLRVTKKTAGQRPMLATSTPRAGPIRRNLMRVRKVLMRSAS